MAETYAATDDFVNNLLKKSDYGVTAEQLKAIPGLFDKVALASLGTPQDVKAVITNAFANPVQFVAQELAKNVKDSFYTNWASPTSAGAINPTLQAQQDYLKSNNVSPDVISNIVSGSTQAGLADLAQQQAKKAAFDSNSGLKADFANIMANPVFGTALNIGASYFGGPLGTAALGLAQGKSPEDIAKGAALSYAGGQVASGVGGATGSQVAGQLAGGTASGLLSGQDLSTALTNSAINTGANAAAGGLMNAVKAPAADPYAVGGVYGPDNSDVGGGFNPSGINIPQGEGATLGSIGAAAETPSSNPNLVGSAATGLLSNYLKSLFTGSPSTGSQGTGNMATTTQDSNNLLGSLFGSALTGVGGLMQGSTNTAASQAQAEALRQAGSLASQQSQFRPVGTTTTFGTSNFQIDPTTGQLTSAGYQLSPQLQAYQDQIMGSNRQSLTDATNLQNLGRGYLAQSPEAAAQQYMTSQQALLQPSRDVESARLANQLQQTGRTGVSVAQGGNLGMANPEQQALANARAMQDLQLAAQAQAQGRAQTQFGQGLLTSAYDPFNAGLKTATGVESLGQQPFTMSTDLAKLSSASGANAGRLGLAANMSAADAALKAGQYNPYATAAAGLGGSSLFGKALGNAVGNTGVGSALAQYLASLGGSNVGTGLDVSNIDYNNLAKIYANGNPFDGVLGANETWMGE